MVLGKLSVPGCLAGLGTGGAGPTAFAVGAGGGCLDVYAPVYYFSSFSLSGRRSDID